MNISFRISLLITFVTILVISVSTYTNTNSLTEGFIDNEKTWSGSITHAISDVITEDTINNNISKLKETLNNIVNNNNTIEYAYITDFNNKIVTHTFKEGFPEHLFKQLNSNHDQQIKINNKLILNISHEISHGLDAKLFLGINRSITDSYINKLRQTSIYSGISVGMAALAIGLFLSRRINQPLNQITRTLIETEKTNQLNKINLPETGPPEIKALSTAFTNVLNSRNEAQQDAVNRQSQLNLLLDSTGECIYGIDTNGNATFANKACIKTLGFDSEQEVLGKNIHNLIHHKYKDGTQYPVEKCNIYKSYTQGIHTFCDNETFWRKDGSSLPVAYNSYPIMDKDEITGSVVLFTDISKKLIKESELKKANDINFHILTKSPIGIALYNTNGDCIIANQALADIVGATQDQVLKQNYHNINSWKECGLYDAAINCIKHKHDNRSEYTLTSTFNKYISVDAYFTSINIDNSDHLLLLISDVTEKKSIESELIRAKESNSKAESIAHIGNWDWDIITGNLYWTDEIYRIFGYEPQEFGATYEAFLNTIHPDDRQHVIDAVNASVADANTPYSIEHKLVKPDGTIRVVYENGKVYRNDSGEPIRMIGTVHDITERKAAEHELELHRLHLEQLIEQRTAELREAQDELIRKERLATLGNLTATVSHELRNPLGAMRPSVYILQKKVDLSDEKLANAIARIDRNITRCDHIIDELLDFTRISDLELTRINIDNWIDNIIREYHKHPDIEFIFNPGSDQAEVIFDPERLRRAMINIMDNGVHAILDESIPETNRNNSRLTIETLKSNNQIKIMISDTGTGIPDDVLPRIYEPLFSTKGFGVGLGMPVVKQIIEQHHGDISIKSDERGTCITLLLPLINEAREV